jgi:hypothetical protein
MMLYFLNLILTLLLIPHFSIFFYDKHNDFISKVHFESIIVLTFIQKKL